MEGGHVSVWKAGDTQPPMVVDCFDAAGAPADLSQATSVTVRVWKAGTLVWERAANKPSDGVVTLNLQPSDTQYPGTYRVKVRAIWPNNGGQQHYPPGDNYMTMTVTR
jgi:hypothetical protein